MDNSQNSDSEDGFYCTCFNCDNTQYCPDCLISYKKEHSFCGKCGKTLVSFEQFLSQNCPVCSQERLTLQARSIKIFRMKSVPDIEFETPKFLGGLIVTGSYCNCGKYTPRSTSGIINTDCSNCGGKKREVALV